MKKRIKRWYIGKIIDLSNSVLLRYEITKSLYTKDVLNTYSLKELKKNKWRLEMRIKFIRMGNEIECNFK